MIHFLEQSSLIDLYTHNEWGYFYLCSQSSINLTVELESKIKKNHYLL